jgi:cyanophycin synthetase
LLLIFADALVRSWKQITKFKTAAAPALAPSPPPVNESRGNGASARGPRDHSAPITPETVPEFNFEGLIRDERGIHMAPESSD